MTIYTSQHPNGAHPWTAIYISESFKHVGCGRTEAEAIADLRRLLGEKAECDQQDADEPGEKREADDLYLIERLIDRYGIGRMLMIVSEICGAKAEHIAVNWQDASLAKRWATLEGAVGIIVPKAEGL